MDHGNLVDWPMGLSPQELRLDHMISTLSSQDLAGLPLDMENQGYGSSTGFQFNRNEQSLQFNGMSQLGDPSS
jgi:hypothetical protein